MWNVASCVAQGMSHKHLQLPCQDRVYYLHCEDTEVIALADGAGSASHSQWGAEVVTEKICQLFTERFQNYIHTSDAISVKQEIVKELLAALEQTAKSQQCNIEDLASTILAVAVSGDSFLALHIGDGVIGCIKNDEVKVVSHPQNGEFANQTYFVTSRNALHFMEIYKGSCKDISYFVLMSDGTQNSLYDRQKKALIPAIHHIAEWNSSLTREDMQDSLEYAMLQVVVPNTQDDCSIIMMGLAAAYWQLGQKERWERLQFKGSYCDRRNKKRMKKMDVIITACSKYPMCLKELSRKTYIEVKYLKQPVAYLMSCGLLRKTEGNRFTV